MRSWESEPRFFLFAGRADSQDLMDQIPASQKRVKKGLILLVTRRWVNPEDNTPYCPDREIIYIVVILFPDLTLLQ
ncbi:MAG: hypothetical protein ACR2Q4_13635 [Geminicoccaceae bacterium]